MYSPKDGHAIAYLSNGNADVKLGVMGVVSGILTDQNVHFPEYRKADELANINPYLGIYTNDEIPMRISITARDGELYCQGDDQPVIRLSAINGRRFECTNLDLVIEFDPENNIFILTQEKSSYTFKRE